MVDVQFGLRQTGYEVESGLPRCSHSDGRRPRPVRRSDGSAFIQTGRHSDGSYGERLPDTACTNAPIDLGGLGQGVDLTADWGDGLRQSRSPAGRRRSREHAAGLRLQPGRPQPARGAELWSARSMPGSSTVPAVGEDQDLVRHAGLEVLLLLAVRRQHRLVETGAGGTCAFRPVGGLSSASCRCPAVRRPVDTTGR